MSYATRSSSASTPSCRRRSTRNLPERGQKNMAVIWQTVANVWAGTGTRAARSPLLTVDQSWSQTIHSNETFTISSVQASPAVASSATPSAAAASLATSTQPPPPLPRHRRLPRHRHPRNRPFRHLRRRRRHPRHRLRPRASARPRHRLRHRPHHLRPLLLLHLRLSSAPSPPPLLPPSSAPPIGRPIESKDLD